MNARAGAQSALELGLGVQIVYEHRWSYKSRSNAIYIASGLSVICIRHWMRKALL